MKNEFTRGITAAVLAPFFIALGIILTKFAGDTVPGLLIAGLGSLFSVPVLLGMHMISRKELDIRKILVELRCPFLKVLLARAIIGQALIITGFTLTTAVKAVLLLRVEPVFVFVWSVFLLREKPTFQKMVLLVILLAGTGLVVAPGTDTGGVSLGDVLILVALCVLSYGYIPTREVVAVASPAGLNILTNLIGGLTLTAAGVLFYGTDSLDLSWQAYGLVVAYALCFAVIAASLYFYAFTVLKPWVIASFLSLEAVYGLILAALFLAEAITPMQISGTIIVLIANYTIGRCARPSY